MSLWLTKDLLEPVLALRELSVCWPGSARAGKSLQVLSSPGVQNLVYLGRFPHHLLSHIPELTGFICLKCYIALTWLVLR